MVVFSPCVDCKHLFNETEDDEVNVKFKCPSYPDGIPDEIFFDGSGSLCKIKEQFGL